MTYYTLPARLISIGHWDERKARTGLLICFALFRSAPSTHPLCTFLFITHLASVLRIIHGDLFSQHPTIFRVRCKAMFASSSEIGIERRHAQLHRGILLSSNHSEGYASLTMRKGEILEHFNKKPFAARELAYKLVGLSNTRKILESLNLEGHPAVTEFNVADKLQDVPYNIANRIVYRSDLQTQFAELPDCFESDDDDDDEGGGGGGGGPPGLVDWLPDAPDGGGNEGSAGGSGASPSAGPAGSSAASGSGSGSSPSGVVMCAAAAAAASSGTGTSGTSGGDGELAPTLPPPPAAPPAAPPPTGKPPLQPHKKPHKDKSAAAAVVATPANSETIGKGIMHRLVTDAGCRHFLSTSLRSSVYTIKGQVGRELQSLDDQLLRPITLPGEVDFLSLLREDLIDMAMLAQASAITIIKHQSGLGNLFVSAPEDCSSQVGDGHIFLSEFRNIFDRLYCNNLTGHAVASS